MSDQALGIIALAALALSAFFSGCETALISADRIRLRHLAVSGNPGAKLALSYIHDPGHFLSAVLVGTNLGNIGCAASFTALAVHQFGDAGVTVATVVLVPMILIFGEILPKGIFLYYADKAAIISVFPLRVLSFVLYPVIMLFSVFTDAVMNLLRARTRKKQMSMTMEELLFHLEHSEEAGLIERETKTLASRALRLRKLKARDVMVPLESVVMIPQSIEINDYMEALAREDYSRLPVYQGQRENIVGILSIHNALKVATRRAGRLHLEVPYFIPLDFPIAEVLFKMKDQGCHMAIIRDESGRIVGMTTLEDIIERLVGEIEDEFH
ncbi:MAG: DUF21 domain-containing protein [Candidatus Latescibacteria bacterium]|nr:DUF21 domain-containing protein [Candidatus Latescibacterota bacterium]NIO27238.1 DUF21 domain-containing protein [Candidatus Latescibacterota bacterium]NIO54762.1 DUF21 domain-containing protein [Candidatus Latescibacterota bacterium]NIT00845.1 DUF21 domain-containing protein [Candidatus Latescibacterota bacterium]NIT37768.1 DUF21 domain-containing protein [Candidatus Latescibacterota bacterium]